MHIQYHQNIYDDNFDLNTLSAEERKQAAAHQLGDPFPVAAAIILHYITLGIFSFIYYGLKHDDLPKLKSDDPNGLAAALLMFVPLFNCYWRFMCWVRLVRRLEFQYRLKGQESPVKHGLAVACMVCTFIPLANLVNFLILMPILISRIQAAIDGLGEANAFNKDYAN